MTQIGDATKAWQMNMHWPLYSQCAVWNQAKRRVEIFECMRDHVAAPGTEPSPTSPYWRFLALR